jgi:hypothetical protein
MARNGPRASRARSRRGYLLSLTYAQKSDDLGIHASSIRVVSSEEQLAWVMAGWDHRGSYCCRSQPLAYNLVHNVLEASAREANPLVQRRGQIIVEGQSCAHGPNLACGHQGIKAVDTRQAMRSRTEIVALRSCPTPTALIGAPEISCRYST